MPLPLAAAAGITAGSALLGGKAGKSQAETMSQPTYSYASPPSWLGGQGALSQGLDYLQQFYGPGGNLPNIGPSDQQNYIAALLGNQASQGFQIPGLDQFGGGGGVGGFTPHLFAGAGGGGGGWQNFVNTMSPYAQGGGNWKGFLKHAQGLEATPTGYESDVLAGRYLDTQNAPELRAMQDAIVRESNEQQTRAMSQAVSPFMADAGTMGMSGAAAATQRLVADDYGENLTNALAGANYNLYGAERQRMNEVDAILSGRTQNLQNVGASAFASSTAAAAQRASAMMSAGASAYGSDNALAAALQSALIGADARGYAAQAAARASMYGADKGLQAAWLGANNQNNALNLQSLGSAYDAYSHLQGMNNQNAMFPMQAASQYWNMLNSGMGQWATQYNQGPQYSPQGGFKQGMAGGALGGLGGTLPYTKYGQTT